jgi:hypothetical protein
MSESTVELDVCVTVHHYFNNVNNQQDVTNFSFINLFKLAHSISTVAPIGSRDGVLYQKLYI